MQCKANGPYVFDRYTGPLRVNAVILDKKARAIRVSACNLLPMHTQGGNRIDRFEVPTQ